MNNLLDLVLPGLPLASRNNAYPDSLPVWRALMNGSVTLIRGRCFLTATAGPDGWHNLFPGWGSLDQGSFSLLQAPFITVATMFPAPAVFEALFTCPTRKVLLIIVHFVVKDSKVC